MIRTTHVRPALARWHGATPTLVLAAALVAAPIGARARVDAQPPTTMPAPAPRPTPVPAQPDTIRSEPGRPAPTDSAAGVVVPAGAAPAGTLGDSASGAQLDSLVSAFRGDVTALPPADAAQMVGSWQAQLAGSGDEQLADIAVDLGALREALAAPAVDRAVVATLLSRLAPKVTAAAPKAGDRAPQLRALGESLDRTAARLRAAP